MDLSNYTKVVCPDCTCVTYTLSDKAAARYRTSPRTGMTLACGESGYAGSDYFVFDTATKVVKFDGSRELSSAPFASCRIKVTKGADGMITADFGDVDWKVEASVKKETYYHMPMAMVVSTIAGEIKI